MSNQEYANFDEVSVYSLYEKWDTEEQARKGGVKTYVADSKSGLVYDSGKSDYSVTVERVLGVDGQEKMSTDDSSGTHRMSLLILKIVVTARKPECRVRAVAATLSLKDPKTDSKANPILEAWAPFRRLQLTNPQTVVFKKTEKKLANFGANFYGAEAHTELRREKEIAFEHVYYDTAFASPVMNHDTRQRGGITWYMEQSKIQTKGVPPELFVAVLFTRDTDDDYLMGFDIDVYGDTAYDFRKKLKRVFGLKPGHTKPFLVRPSRSPAIRGGEGRDFLRSVRSNNLGELRAKDDSTGLSIFRKAEPAVDAGYKGSTGGEAEQNVGVDRGVDEEENGEGGWGGT
ncbi:hypothetical protein F4782DRAFT_284746 [Xylaria castorea]|nr:hypothetical protein F4782DRAFT_284746 [Xylaria castorea]